MSHTETQHMTANGIYIYKGESEEQRRSLSTILNSASNGHPPPYSVEVQKKPKLGNDNLGTQCHDPAITINS